jgi:hypothetical protein
LREDGNVNPLDTLASSEAKEKNTEREKAKRDNVPGHGHHEKSPSVVFSAVGSELKQRLQAAVSGAH